MNPWEIDWSKSSPSTAESPPPWEQDWSGTSQASAKTFSFSADTARSEADLKKRYKQGLVDEGGLADFNKFKSDFVKAKPGEELFDPVSQQKIVKQGDDTYTAPGWTPPPVSTEEQATSLAMGLGVGPGYGAMKGAGLATKLVSESRPIARFLAGLGGGLAGGAGVGAAQNKLIETLSPDAAEAIAQTAKERPLETLVGSALGGNAPFQKILPTASGTIVDDLVNRAIGAGSGAGISLARGMLPGNEIDMKDVGEQALLGALFTNPTKLGEKALGITAKLGNIKAKGGDSLVAKNQVANEIALPPVEDLSTLAMQPDAMSQLLLEKGQAGLTQPAGAPPSGGTGDLGYYEPGPRRMSIEPEPAGEYRGGRRKPRLDLSEINKPTPDFNDPLVLASLHDEITQNAFEEGVKSAKEAQKKVEDAATAKKAEQEAASVSKELGFEQTSHTPEKVVKVGDAEYAKVGNEWIRATGETVTDPTVIKVLEARHGKENVDIGQRNPEVSTGTGKPTAFEEKMLADWKAKIAQEQAVKPVSSLSNPEVVSEPLPEPQKPAKGKETVPNKDLERAIKRRNIEKDGRLIKGGQGEDATPENVAAHVARAEANIKDREETISKITKAREANPKANYTEAVALIRKILPSDARAYTWDEAINVERNLIKDAKEYIADVKAAGEAYKPKIEATKETASNEPSLSEPELPFSIKEGKMVDSFDREIVRNPETKRYELVQPKGINQAGEAGMIVNPFEKPESRDTFLKAFSKAFDKVQERTEYGVRSEAPTERSRVLVWSNGARRWIVGRDYPANTRIDHLDANYVVVPWTTIKQAEVMAQHLPPLPLDSFSSESMMRATDQPGLTGEDKTKAWLEHFASAEPIKSDKQKYLDSVMDKINSEFRPKSGMSSEAGGILHPSEMLKAAGERLQPIREGIQKASDFVSEGFANASEQRKASSEKPAAPEQASVNFPKPGEGRAQSRSEIKAIKEIDSTSKLALKPIKDTITGKEIPENIAHNAKLIHENLTKSAADNGNESPPESLASDIAKLPEHYVPFFSDLASRIPLLGKIPFGAGKTFSDAVGTVAKFIRRQGGLSADNIRDVFPALAGDIVKMEHEEGLAANALFNDVTPFWKEARKALPKEAYDALGRAAMSGNRQEMESIISSVPEAPELKAALDKNLEAKARGLEMERAAGREVGELDTYFHRVLHDREGLLKALGHERSVIDDAIAKAEQEKGHLTEEDKNDIVNSVIEGSFNGKKGPGFLHERKLAEITPELDKFYEHPEVGDIIWAQRVARDVTNRKYFGKIDPTDADVMGHGGSFGERINQGKASGIIRKRGEDMIRQNMVSLFDKRKKFDEDINKLATGFRKMQTFGYLSDIGTAAVQFADIFSIMREYGALDALKSYSKGKPDISTIGVTEGHNQDIQEFSRRAKGSVTRQLEKPFRFAMKNLIGRADTLQKSALIKAATSSLHRAFVEADSAQYRQMEKRYSQEFPERWEGMKEAIKSKDFVEGKWNDDASLLLFSELARLQPTSSSSRAQGFNEASEFKKIFYTLRSYPLKQVGILREQAYNELKRGNTAHGFARLITYLTLVAAGQQVFQFAKDKALDRPDQTFDEYAAAGILQLAMVPRYSIYRAKQEGIGTAAMETLVPGLGMVNDFGKDLLTTAKFATETKGQNGRTQIPDLGTLAQNLEAPKYIPGVGREIYSLLGKGSLKNQKEKDRERKGLTPRPTTLGELESWLNPPDATRR